MSVEFCADGMTDSNRRAKATKGALNGPYLTMAIATRGMHKKRVNEMPTTIRHIRNGIS